MGNNDRSMKEVKWQSGRVVLEFEKVLGSIICEFFCFSLRSGPLLVRLGSVWELFRSSTENLDLLRVSGSR